jgi:hypothetical protein
MPHARLTDPGTSHEAADSVGNLTETKKAIFYILKYPRTDAELIDSYNTLVQRNEAPRASESGIRSRRAELVDDGLVIDTGHRAKSPSGRNMIVWAIV